MRNLKNCLQNVMFLTCENNQYRYNRLKGGTNAKCSLREINALNLTAKQLHTNLLAHSIDTKLPQITTGVQSNFEGKKVFITELVDFLDNHIILVDKLPTESNIKYKVINEILSRFNLEGLAKNPFESYLNDLLNFRNKTSHGENVSFITAQIVEESVNHVIILMQEIIDKILQGCNDKSYLAIP